MTESPQPTFKEFFDKFEVWMQETCAMFEGISGLRPARKYITVKTTPEDVLHLKAWEEPGEICFQIASQSKAGEYIYLRNRRGEPSNVEVFAPCSTYRFEFSKNSGGPWFNIVPPGPPPTIIQFSLCDTDAPYKDFVMRCPKEIWPYFIEAIVWFNRVQEARGMLETEAQKVEAETPEKPLGTADLFSFVKGAIEGLKTRLDGHDARIPSVEKELGALNVALVEHFKKRDKHLARIDERLDSIIQKLQSPGLIEVLDEKSFAFSPPGVDVEVRHYAGRPDLLFSKRYLTPPRVGEGVLYSGMLYSVKSVVWDTLRDKMLIYVILEGEAPSKNAD